MFTQVVLGEGTDEEPPTERLRDEPLQVAHSPGGNDQDAGMGPEAEEPFHLPVAFE